MERLYEIVITTPRVAPDVRKRIESRVKSTLKATHRSLDGMKIIYAMAGKSCINVRRPNGDLCYQYHCDSGGFSVTARSPSHEELNILEAIWRSVLYAINPHKVAFNHDINQIITITLPEDMEDIASLTSVTSLARRLEEAMDKKNWRAEIRIEISASILIPKYRLDDPNQPNRALHYKGLPHVITYRKQINACLNSVVEIEGLPTLLFKGQTEKEHDEYASSLSRRAEIMLDTLASPEALEGRHTDEQWGSF